MIVIFDTYTTQSSRRIVDLFIVVIFITSFQSLVAQQSNNLTMIKLPPLLKASLTSGTVMACGDMLCQKIRQPKNPVNWPQTSRFAIIGATLHGPYFFKGFRWLDTRFGTSNSLQHAITKSLIGQVTQLSVLFFPLILMHDKRVSPKLFETALTIYMYYNICINITGNSIPCIPHSILHIYGRPRRPGHNSKYTQT